MNSIQQWEVIIKVIPPRMRAFKFKKWRREKVIPDNWLVALEAAYPPVPEHPLPSVAQQLMNAGNAAVRNVGHVLAGGKLRVPDIEALRRQGICEGNACGYFRASDNRCGHEGCACFLKYKPYLEAERCPDGRW